MKFAGIHKEKLHKFLRGKPRFPTGKRFVKEISFFSKPKRTSKKITLYGNFVTSLSKEKVFESVRKFNYTIFDGSTYEEEIQKSVCNGQDTYVFTRLIDINGNPVKSTEWGDEEINQYINNYEDTKSANI